MREGMGHDWSTGGGLLLYLLTLLLEVPGMVLRFLLGLVLAPLLFLPFGALWVALFERGGDHVAHLLFTMGTDLATGFALLVALGGPVTSLLTLIALPGGAWLTRWSLGAREPSMREREQIILALQNAAAQAPEGTTGPSRWFVLDRTTPEAFVIGTTLYLSRVMIHSPYLMAVLAHELGHLNSLDGRMTLALRRLVLPPVLWVSAGLGQIAPRAVAASVLMRSSAGCIAGTLMGLGALFLLLAGGGIGLWLLNPLWVGYWRSREFAADAFAAACGYADQLAQFLEQRQFFDVPVPYFMTPEPPIELRIDRLIAYSTLS
jgi:Zn-dependent protease with chaperone function